MVTLGFRLEAPDQTVSLVYLVKHLTVTEENRVRVPETPHGSMVQWTECKATDLVI